MIQDFPTASYTVKFTPAYSCALVLAQLKRNKPSGTLVPFLRKIIDGVMVEEERPPNDLLLSLGALFLAKDTKDAIGKA
jgi:hypothetical protein